ncbi:hypothetical protein AYI70_g6601 [Smittium culicis]|uniref:Uncharacterized protein n=1 Tax=Smittium culicis TaxID=133412 RepID=A0A1R1XP98_9FUNG|nr:hypothetical protein AYI70_g6601 [Smittium culicis]
MLRWCLSSASILSAAVWWNRKYPSYPPSSNGEFPVYLSRLTNAPHGTPALHSPEMSAAGGVSDFVMFPPPTLQRYLLPSSDILDTVPSDAITNMPHGSKFPASDSIANTCLSISPLCASTYAADPLPLYSSLFHNNTLTVRLGRKGSLDRILTAWYDANAPPPSSIAPTPTSQESKCPLNNTISSGSSEPLSSITTLLLTFALSIYSGFITIFTLGITNLFALRIPGFFCAAMYLAYILCISLESSILIAAPGIDAGFIAPACGVTSETIFPLIFALPNSSNSSNVLTGSTSASIPSGPVPTDSPSPNIGILITGGYRVGTYNSTRSSFLFQISTVTGSVHASSSLWFFASESTHSTDLSYCTCPVMRCPYKSVISARSSHTSVSFAFPALSSSKLTIFAPFVLTFFPTYWLLVNAAISDPKIARFTNSVSFIIKFLATGQKLKKKNIAVNKKN